MPASALPPSGVTLRDAGIIVRDQKPPTVASATPGVSVRVESRNCWRGAAAAASEAAALRVESVVPAWPAGLLPRRKPSAPTQEGPLTVDGREREPLKAIPNEKPFRGDNDWAPNELRLALPAAGATKWHGLLSGDTAAGRPGGDPYRECRLGAAELTAAQICFVGVCPGCANGRGGVRAPLFTGAVATDAEAATGGAAASDADIAFGALGSGSADASGASWAPAAASAAAAGVVTREPAGNDSPPDASSAAFGCVNACAGCSRGNAADARAAAGAELVIALGSATTASWAAEGTDDAQRHGVGARPLGSMAATLGGEETKELLRLLLRQVLTGPWSTAERTKEPPDTGWAAATHPLGQQEAEAAVGCGAPLGGTTAPATVDPGAVAVTVATAPGAAVAFGELASTPAPATALPAAVSIMGARGVLPTEDCMPATGHAQHPLSTAALLAPAGGACCCSRSSCSRSANCNVRTPSAASSLPMFTPTLAAAAPPSGGFTSRAARPRIVLPTAAAACLAGSICKGAGAMAAAGGGTATGTVAVSSAPRGGNNRAGCGKTASWPLGGIGKPVEQLAPATAAPVACSACAVVGAA